MNNSPTFTILILLIFPLLSLLLSQISESRLTKQDLPSSFHHSSSSSSTQQGTQWAVLVAGSNGYANYRHQADVCHAYQILKKGGLKDEHIIVFMYDDIAHNEENPKKGIIINNPSGQDVYKGVPKDYTREEVTTGNLKAAILGDKTGIKGGSGKVVNSGPDDTIFIYYADHGSPGVLTMPTDEDLYAKDFIDTLKKKHESGTYKSMVIYIEACEAGSIFQGLMSKEWNIYVTTASNPSESSWATYCPEFDPSTPSEYDTCLGDLYSVAWMEDSEVQNLQSETLAQQYQVVKKRTAAGKERGSHVMEYGSTMLSEYPLATYLGTTSTTTSNKHHPKITHPYNTNNNNDASETTQPLSTVEQHDADILYLKLKVRRAAEGSDKRAKAEKELEDAISHRQHVDSTIQAIGNALSQASKAFGDVLTTVRPTDQPIVDDWDCFKSLAGTYKTHCGPLSTYGKKHMRAFANMCNAGVQMDQMAQVAAQVCGNNNNNNN